MNKFVKALLIAAAIFAVAGISFGISGAIIAGGLDVLVSQASSGQLNYSNWHFEDGINWTSEDGKVKVDMGDMVEKELATLIMEESRYTYGSEVKNIVVSTQLGDVDIEASDEVSEITVEVKDARLIYFSEKVDGDTLYLTYDETGVSLGTFDAPEINIEIPRGWDILNIAVETNLGDVDVNGFKNGCADLNLTTALGNVEVEGCHVNGRFYGHSAMGDVKVKDTYCMGADLNTDMGNVKFYGRTDGDLNLTTAMGDAKAELEGSEDDYSVEIDTNMGDAIYQSYHHNEGSGNGHHSEKHNGMGGSYSHHREGARAKICLQSSMGDVDLCFKN